MNCRGIRALFLSFVALIGLLAGVSFSAAGAGSASGRVLHLVQEAHSADPSVPSRSVEYWLDEGRRFAKVTRRTDAARVITASTGPDWMLHIPEEGAALQFETPLGGGPTRSIFASLYYMRDGFNAGAAKLVAGTDTTFTVELGSRRAEFERVSGLPLWESFAGSRVDYAYPMREELPTSSFPPEFFFDTAGRDVAHSVDTTPAKAAQRVSFTLLSAGPNLLGRRLEKTLLSYGANDWTIEQVGQVYEDIQISQSLLARVPALRPGGVAFVTALGSGTLYDEGGSVQFLLVNGRSATSIVAPDRQTVLAIAALLRPVR